MEVPTEKELEDNPRYVPTGTIISRQVIGIAVISVVTEYYAVEYYDKKKGWNVHLHFLFG